MSTETKPEINPRKPNFYHLLKEKRAFLAMMQRDAQTAAAVRKNILNEALNKALVERRNAISEITKSSDARRKAIKESTEADKAMVLKRYDEAFKDLLKVRDDALEVVHRAKEVAYAVIHDELDKLVTPHIEKHKLAMMVLNEKYQEDEGEFQLRDEKAMAEVMGDIKDLEEEIAVRRAQVAERDANLSPATPTPPPGSYP